MKRTATLLLSLLFSCAALAQPQAYQVELLIYSHLTPEAIGSEHWPAITDHNDTHLAASIALAPATSSPLNSYPMLTLLPHSAWQLSYHAQRIRQQLPGTILYHQAWRVNRVELAGKSMIFAIHNDNQLDTARDASQLGGTLSIRLAHYFDTDLQLTIAEPHDLIRSHLSGQANPCWHSHHCFFSVDIQRRTRSGIINYLDHPLYGALLKITPVAE